MHPNAQAELGTYFTGLAKSGGQLFIETHSDNLILRIQRHIAEGILEPSDVKVFFFRDTKTGKRVTDLRLDDRGVFRTKWPGGFFPQRQKESFELAKSFSKKEEKQQLELKTILD